MLKMQFFVKLENKMRSVLTLMAASALLVACGGGSDNNDFDNAPPGTPTGFLTQSNYVPVAQTVLSTNAYLLNAASISIGAEVSDPAVLVKFGQDQLHKLLRRGAAAPVQALGVIETDEERCSGGGKVVFQYNDANNNGREDRGDSFTINAQNCSQNGTVLNGQMKLTLDSVEGDTDSDRYQLSATAVYTNLAATSAGTRVTGNGTMGFSFATQGDDFQDVIARASSFSFTTVSGSQTSNQTMKDYEVSLRTRPSGSQQVYTSSINGTIIDSAFASQSFTVKTTQPFVRLSSQRYADRGEVLVIDSKNAKMRATVTSATTLTIGLDADGNGSYETGVNKLWSDIL